MSRSEVQGLLSTMSSWGGVARIGHVTVLGRSPRMTRSTKAIKFVGNGVKGVLGIGGNQDGKATFSSSIGVALSMVGTTVGTGNIWRFPRIMASNAEEGGGLVFLLTWFLFLLIWSIPLNLVQYGTGRYTKVCVVESFAKLIGPSYRWLGGFIVGTNFLIGAMYSVLLGYCGYYAFLFMAKPLPDSLETAESHFDTLINSPWTIIFHALFTMLATLALIRGVSTIEPVNRVIVPLLMVIIVFTLYWSMFLPYAGMGLIHMFKPSWKSFGNAQIWRDALTQNAWDTAAGTGLFLTYATYMTRHQGAVKMGICIPAINNFISLMSGMTVFCNVFSYEYRKGSSLETIIDVLKTNGPFNTGITFIQMPLLYGSINGGRVLAIVFFIGVSLAGLSSLISILEQSVHVLEDFGIRRVPGAILVCVLSSLVGLASAFSNDFFVNQDATWSQALIICGCILMFLVARYGPLKFRRELYNKFGIGDWKLPLLWVFLIVCVCPIEGVSMMIWWIVDQVMNNSDPYYPNTPWWQFTPTSLIIIVFQWIFLFCVVFGLNWWMKPITTTNDHSEPGTRTYWSRIRDLFIIREDEPGHFDNIGVPPPIFTQDVSSSESSVDDDDVKYQESSLNDDPDSMSDGISTPRPLAAEKEMSELSDVHVIPPDGIDTHRKVLPGPGTTNGTLGDYDDFGTPRVPSSMATVNVVTDEEEEPGEDVTLL